MPRYKVYFEAVVYAECEVEAENEKEAMEEADSRLSDCDNWIEEEQDPEYKSIYAEVIGEEPENE